jgi:hypothetical protein
MLTLTGSVSILIWKDWYAPTRESTIDRTNLHFWATYGYIFCVFLEYLVNIAARYFLKVLKRHVQTELRLESSCRAAWGRTRSFISTSLFSVVFRLVLSEMFRDWVNQWWASAPRTLYHDLVLMIYMQRCRVWIFPEFILLWLSYLIEVYVLPHKCWDCNLN